MRERLYDRCRLMLVALTLASIYGPKSSSASGAVPQSSPASTEPSGVLLPPSKAEIAAVINSDRSRIEDLSVSFSFNALRDAPDNLQYVSHSSFVTKGMLVYMEEQYGSAPELKKRVFFVERAFDGRITTINFRDRGRAMIQRARLRETMPSGAGFFDINMLNLSPDEDPNSSNGPSLTGVISAPTSQVRRSLEIVGNHQCVAIDYRDPQSGKVALELWLDMAHRFAPIRQVYYDKSGGWVIELLADELLEVEPNLWLAVRGHKRVPADAYGPEAEHLLEVDKNADGSFALSVNSNVPDGFFQLWKRLPPGTRLDDNDKKISVTVGGTDYAALAMSLNQSMIANGVTGIHSTGSNAHLLREWIFALIIAFALSVTAIIWNKRRIGRKPHD